ncbi:MAG: hypothetical protein A2Z83_09635 [Omnitrophica bacterium GWA2_52_8]|nr:MAG: hypothetical protein A2Z83_09635 [Omnitrophica bacterium GWA2_52_8]
MVHIQHRSLGPFKKHALFMFRRRGKIGRRIERILEQTFAEPHRMGINLIEGKPPVPVDLFQNSVFLPHDGSKPFFKELRAVQVRNPDTEPGHLIRVTRTDAFFGGADDVLGFKVAFAQLVEQPVIRK